MDETTLLATVDDIKVVVLIFVDNIFVDVKLLDAILADVIKVVALIVPALKLLVDKLAVEIRVDARIVPDVILVPVKSVTIVKPVDKSAFPVTRIVAVVIDVTETIPPV